MRKLLLIAGFILASLMPAYALAQVFGQNQVIVAPFGSNGFVVSTTTANGAKLSATSTPYFANFFATIGNITKLGNLTSNGLVKTSSGNGTLGTAVNGTDFSLIVANTCGAGQFFNSATAAGVFGCGTPSGTTYTGTYPIIVSGSVISTGFSTTTQNNFNAQNTFTSLFATLSTSTNATTTGSQYFTGVTASRPLYVDSAGKLGSAGSGTSGNCVQWAANNTLGDAGSACGTGGGGGTFSFTPSTNYGALTNATNTPLWFKQGLQASSTSYFVSASSTDFTVSNNLYNGSLIGTPDAYLQNQSNTAYLWIRDSNGIAELGGFNGANNSSLDIGGDIVFQSDLDIRFINTNGGVYKFASPNFDGTLNFSALSAGRTFTFANEAGTVALGTGSAGNCAQWSTTNTLTAAAAPCGSGGGSSFPFTPTTYGNATGTLIGFTGGILAVGSSTIVGNATTTGNHAVGSLTVAADRITDITGTGLSTSAGALTVSGLTTTQFSSANVSQWTNDASYLVNTRNINTTYPLQGGGNLTADRTLTLAFGTTTQNFWNAYNNFSSAFITNASSTNATTTGSVYFTGVTASRPLYIDSTGKLGSAGSGTSGNCVQWAANNTFGDAGAACATSSGSPFPFTPTTNFGTTTSATSTPLWAVMGIYASSTSRIASTTFAVTGNVMIGTSTDTTFAGNPAKLTVEMGVGNTSEEGINLGGSLNDFLEYNCRNRSTGTSAQCGYTATADNGTATTGFMFMGINNSAFWNPQTYNVGGSGDSNILSLGNDMFIAQGTSGKKTHFLNGGTSTSTNEVMTFSGNNVGVGTTSPWKAFSVVGDTIIKGAAAATSTMYISSTDTTKGGRIILKDTNGTTCTEITTLSGSMNSKAVTCP